MSSDGQHLLGAGGKDIILWETANGKELIRAPAAPGLALVAVFAPTDDAFACGGDGTVWLFDESGANPRAIPVGEWVHAMAFTPDARMLVIGSIHDPGRLVDIARRRKVATLPFQCCAGSLVLSNHGTEVIVGIRDSNLPQAHQGGKAGIACWQLDPPKQLRLIETEFPQRIAVSPDRARVAVASRRILDVYAWKTGKRLWRYDASDEPKSSYESEYFSDIKFSPKGNRIAVSCAYRVFVVDATTGAMVAESG
jgi:WD40 repeat protein